MNNLKQYFEYEKNKSYFIDSSLSVDDKNNFRRLLNKLELKNPANAKPDKIKSGIVEKESLVSVYTKYFVGLAAPLALAPKPAAYAEAL